MIIWSVAKQRRTFFWRGKPFVFPIKILGPFWPTGLKIPIGGPDIPGIGFAMGIERIVLLVQKKTETSRFPNLFIAALGEEAQLKGFELANRLHREGIKVEIDYEGRSLKAQMRRADKLNARYVIIIGEEELKTGRAMLRDMGKKVQEEISLDQAIEEIKRRG